MVRWFLVDIVCYGMKMKRTPNIILVLRLFCQAPYRIDAGFAVECGDSQPISVKWFVDLQSVMSGTIPSEQGNRRTVPCPPADSCQIVHLPSDKYVKHTMALTDFKEYRPHSQSIIA